MPPALTPITLLARTNDCVPDSVWERADGRELIELLARHTPPARIVAKLFEQGTELTNDTIIALWPHLDTEGREALTEAVGEWGNLECVAQLASTLDEACAVERYASGNPRVHEQLVTNTLLDRDARIAMLRRAYHTAETKQVTNLVTFVGACASGNVKGVDTDDVREALGPAHTSPQRLQWWLMVADTCDTDMIIGAAVELNDNDSWHRTIAWCTRRSRETLETLWERVRDNTSVDADIVADVERRVANVADLVAAAVAHFETTGDTSLVEQLGEKRRNALNQVSMSAFDPVISDPRCGTGVAWSIAVHIQRHRSVDMLSLRPFDDEFAARVLLYSSSTNTTAVVETELRRTGRAETVAVRAIELRADQNSSTTGDMWEQLAALAGTQLHEISVHAALTAAEHSETIAAALGDVFAKNPVLAVELADGFDGTVADLDATLDASM